MYVEALGKLLPWVYALDHYHYARWLTVHVADLLQLEQTCPSTLSEFCQGHFVTQKTSRKFSAMAHDQVHEQLNAIVKGDGGAIGITENEDALRRWMVAGPEVSRILHEYEDSQETQSEDNHHHEQIPSRRKAFATYVENVVGVIDDMGNPFADDSGELYSLDRKVIMSDDVVKSIRTVEEVGESQYKNFIDNKLTENEAMFYDTITKNNLPLFKSGRKKPSKAKSKLANMKTDIELFSRMYISCQSRDGDLDTFFQHENHSCPPSLATDNRIRQGNKSDLVECIESIGPRLVETPVVDVKIIDGAGIVHALDPKKCTVNVKSFSDYAERVFIPYIHRELRTCKRLDVVWDIYQHNSLKSHVRQSRGDGLAFRVAGNTLMPKNWANFLRVDSNKTGLFAYLASQMKSSTVPEGKLLLSTYGEHVVSSSEMDVSDIDPCTHEEADYRMILHVSHAYRQGSKQILIRATDTDVLVLAVAAASVLEGCQLWLAFGHGSRFRHIPAHVIADVLGPERSWGLLFIHAISGCDTVSFIHGVGKKTAWDVWRSIPELGSIFNKLSHAPAAVSEADMTALEQYFVLLYSRTAPWTKVTTAHVRTGQPTPRKHPANHRSPAATC